MTLHFDKIGYGQNQICLSRMQAHHQAQVQSSLSSYLLNQKSISEVLQRPLPEFTFSIGRKGTKLDVGDRNYFFDSTKSKSGDLKKVKRVVRFYQHVGQLKRKEDSPSVVERTQAVTKAAVQSIAEASVPGTNGKILTMTNVSENSLSLARDILRAMPAVGPDHPLPHNLAFPVGVIWSGFALRELNGGWADYKRAREIGDSEGRRRATGRMTTGGFATVGSAFFLAGKTATSVGAAAVAATALSLVADFAFGIGSIVGMGLSSLGIYRCHTFLKRLTDYYENPELSEEDRVKGTLEFLKDLLTVTPEEREELVEKIDEENPQASQAEKEALLDEKLKQLTEVKIKYLKRRTSCKSLDLILNQVDPLLAQLADPVTKAAALKEAHSLIAGIRKETKWKMALYIMGLIASIIGLVGVILADVTTLGLPFIIMAVAAFIFLVLTAYNLILQLMKKESEVGGLQLQLPDVGVH